MHFNFEIINDEIHEKPEDGAYIYGLYLEAAKWNISEGILDESDPKILYSPLPSIHLFPCE